jgi:hypothetical protein
MRRIVPSLVGIVFVVYIAYLGWLSLGPQKPIPDDNRQRLADRAVTKIGDQLKDGRGEIRSVVLIHFANDPSDYFTNAVQANLDGSGVLNLDDRTIGEKIRNKLNLRNRGCSSLAEALKEAKGSSVQGVLWGRLDKFESHPSGAIVKGNWQLAELRTGRVVCEGKIDEDTTSPASESMARDVRKLKDDIEKHTAITEQTAGLVPWYIRFLGFALLCLLLPVLTISFIRTMVAKRSNKINAFMLAIYTVVDVIFAFMMVGGALNTGWRVCAFLIAGVLALVYNYYLMCFALKLES